MDQVAKRLGMSARSLRRRLKTEGVPYGAVIDEALGRTARRLLEDSNRTLQDIAYAMGFSEPSAFHRAFKRWTGLTPRQYRIEASRGTYTSSFPLQMEAQRR
jgi:AraC-like DNA-binding protein